MSYPIDSGLKLFRALRWFQSLPGIWSGLVGFIAAQFLASKRNGHLLLLVDKEEPSESGQFLGL